MLAVCRFGIALTAFVLSSGAVAQAAREFCPARATEAMPIGVAYGTPALQYSYQLTALSPRTVDASIVADTDRGWYRWSVSDVALAATVHDFPDPRPGYTQSLKFAQADSARLLVAFSDPVAIRHMWVTSASTLPTQSKEAVACDVPAFSGVQDPAPPSRDVGVAPSPKYATAGAMPAPPPFPLQRCATEFLPPALDALAEMTMPAEASDHIAFGVWVAIALDPDGHPLDAWVYASSGQVTGARLDVLSSARASRYSGAISYCRHVDSLYLLSATIP